MHHAPALLQGQLLQGATGHPFATTSYRVRLLAQYVHQHPQQLRLEVVGNCSFREDLMKKFLNLDATSMLLIIACFGFMLWASYLVFYENQTHIYAENGLLENAQACVIAAAGIIYLATAILEKRSDKLIVVFLSLLCLTFLLRELDVDEFDIPYVFIFIGSGIGRNVILVVAFIIIFILAVLKFSYYKTAAADFIKSRPGWMLIAGGIFLLTGDFFEKCDYPFFEEMSEFFGYFLILLSSVASNHFISRTPVYSSENDKTTPELKS